MIPPSKVKTGLETASHLEISKRHQISHEHPVKGGSPFLPSMRKKALFLEDITKTNLVRIDFLGDIVFLPFQRHLFMKNTNFINRLLKGNLSLVF